MKAYGVIRYGVMVAMLFCTCSNAPTAGGSSDSGNVKFAGVIIHESDGPAAGAIVTLCPENFIHGIENTGIASDTSQIRRTVTDAGGRFEFRSVPEGDYCVEVNDRESQALLIRTVIADDDQPLFIEDTLRHWSVLEGNVDLTGNPAGQHYVVVYGLDRKIRVGNDGYFKIPDLPEGVYRVRLISTDSSVAAVEADSIATTSGNTHRIPLLGWKHYTAIYLNTTADGADITDNVYNFPVLVRLTEDNFAFDEAADDGSDLRFTGKDGNPCSFEIERWSSALQKAEIWVMVDTVFGNCDTGFIRMHWGRTGDVPTQATGTVFDTANGFQAVWHLSDTDYLSAKDATPNRYHGVAVGMNESSVAEGVIGVSREFNGTSSHITIPDSKSGSLNVPEDADYTVSAWVYAERLDVVSQAVLSKGDEQYFLCSIGGAGGASHWQFTDFKENEGWRYSSVAASEKEWVYLTGVRNGTEQFLYLNGNMVDSTVSVLASDKTRITTINVSIGNFLAEDGSDDGGFFNGRIDEVRIRNVVSDANWIRLCYMNQRSEDRLIRVEVKQN